MSKTSRCLPALLLALTAGPTLVVAEPPPREFAEKLGYHLLLPGLPARQGMRAAPDPGYAPPDRRSAAGVRAAGDTDTINRHLSPRIYERVDPATMLPTLLRLQRERPDSPKITRKLALICLRSGLLPEARQWFARTWQLDPADLGALWNLAAIAWQVGDTDAAMAFLEEYRQVDPGSPWGRLATQMLRRRDARPDRVFRSRPATTIESSAPAPVDPWNPVKPPSDQQQVLIINGRRTQPDDVGAPPNRFPVDHPLRPASLGSQDFSGRTGAAPGRDPARSAASVKSGAARRRAVFDPSPLTEFAAPEGSDPVPAHTSVAPPLTSGSGTGNAGPGSASAGAAPATGTPPPPAAASGTQP